MNIVAEKNASENANRTNMKEWNQHRESTQQKIFDNFIDINQENFSESDEPLSLNNLWTQDFNLASVLNNIQTRSESELIILFKIKKVKEIIINEFSKQEFHDLLRKDKSGNLLIALLDEEGCKIMSKCKKIGERMSYFFARSPAQNQLRECDYFSKLILNSRETIYLDQKKFDKYCFDIDYISKNINYENNYEFIFKFWEKKQLELVQLLDFPDERLKDNILRFQKESLERLLNNKIQSIDYITNWDFECLVLKGIKIPKHLITPHLVNKILNSNTIFENRILSDELSKNNDVDYFNKALKEKERNVLNSINMQNGLIWKYDILVKEFKQLEFNKNNKREFRNIIYNFNNNLPWGSKLDWELIELLKKTFPNEENILKIIKDQNNIELTDIIIDYHFNDISYNVFLDIKELLNFQLDNGITIPIEHLKIYRDILNLDNLTVQEKIDLHNNLKNKNVSEMFYDDYTNSRDKMYQEISDSILNKEKIEHYKNESLSKIYWVNIYEFNWQEFFGLVRCSKYTNAKPETVWSSFSLVWTDCIWTINNPESDTFIYEWLKPEQIIHVYPSDSYTDTFYWIHSDHTPSDKVRILKSPSDLLKATRHYNELLILRKWLNKSDSYENIWELKPIALYCYDNITHQDIAVAKEENVGIMLIKTEAYKKDKSTAMWFEHDPNYKYINKRLNLKDAKKNRKERTSFVKINELNRIINN